MSASTQRAPSATNRSAIAAPIPLAAPVTTATWPSSRPVIVPPPRSVADRRHVRRSGIADDDALEVGQAGLVAGAQAHEALGPVVVELERAAGLVDDLGRVADVPDLALDVEVAAVDALAEAVVEAPEVAAALAVDPAEVGERVRALGALGVGQPERAAPHPAAAVVELEVVLDVGDRDGAVGAAGSRPCPTRPGRSGRRSRSRRGSALRNSTHWRTPGDPTRRSGRAVPRAAAPGLVAPRVVAEERRAGRRQLVCAGRRPRPSPRSRRPARRWPAR